MWLAHNARWLEEDKERQAKKAKKAEEMEAKRAGKAPRKAAKRNRRTAPFASAREAIDNFAATKKFSSRINMDAIRRLDAGDEYELQSMPDEDDKDDKADDKMDDKADVDDDDDDFEFDIPEGQFIDHKGDSSDEE
jgi:transcription factor IIIB subunit 2